MNSFIQSQLSETSSTIDLFIRLAIILLGLWIVWKNRGAAASIIMVAALGSLAWWALTGGGLARIAELWGQSFG